MRAYACVRVCTRVRMRVSIRQVGVRLLMHKWYRFADVCSIDGGRFQRQRVILITRGLYPMWLRIVVISAHVEVLRKERSGWSKTAAGGIY